MHDWKITCQILAVEAVYDIQSLQWAGHHKLPLVDLQPWLLNNPMEQAEMGQLSADLCMLAYGSLWYSTSSKFKFRAVEHILTICLLGTALLEINNPAMETFPLVKRLVLCGYAQLMIWELSSPSSRARFDLSRTISSTRLLLRSD